MNILIGLLALVVLGVFISILAGCSTYKEILDEPEQKPEVITKEVIKEKIVYRDRNITIPCENITEIINITCPKYQYETANPSSREIELIRRIRFLESQTDKYFNDSDCNDELNETKVKLEDCEEELCYEWNSSWC